MNDEARNDKSALLNLAKQRLQDMTFFGVFERLEDRFVAVWESAKSPNQRPKKIVSLLVA